MMVAVGRLARLHQRAGHLDLGSVTRALYLLAVVLQGLHYVLFVSTFAQDVLGDALPIGFVREKISNYLVYLLFAVFLLDASRHGVSWRRAAFGIVVGLLVQNVSVRYHNAMIVWFLWIVLAYPCDLSLRRVAQAVWVLSAACIALTVCLSLAGFLPDETMFQHGVLRHGLGFVSPNSLAFNVTYALLAWVYAHYESWRQWYAVPIVALLSVVFVVANGRMALLVGLADVGLAVLFHARAHGVRAAAVVRRALCMALPFVAPVCCAWSLVLPAVFAGHTDNAVFSFLNGLLSGRPTYMIDFYQTYGYHLRGQEVHTVSRRMEVLKGMTWKGLDNSYLLYALRFGLVFIVVLVVLYVLLSRSVVRHGDMGMAALVALVLVVGVSENGLLFPQWDLAIFALGAMLARDGACERAGGLGGETRPEEGP